MISSINESYHEKSIFCQAVTDYTTRYPEEGKSETLRLNVLCEFCVNAITYKCDCKDISFCQILEMFKGVVLQTLF